MGSVPPHGAADANLQLIKIVTSKLPFDWGSKVDWLNATASRHHVGSSKISREN